MSTLHPELQSSIVERSNFKMIHHPLVVGIYNEKADFLIDNYNGMFEHKKQDVKEALAQKNLLSYVYLHERPYRVEALTAFIAQYGDGINEEELASNILEIWTDCEHPQNAKGLWLPLFIRRVGPSSIGMIARSYVPSKIYRGTAGAERSLGMSWTTDEAKATWFARRSVGFFGGKPTVYSVVPQADDILAKSDARGESEVIINPTTLKGNKTLARGRLSW